MGAERMNATRQRRFELAVFAALLLVLNAPVAAGRVPSALIFQPDAVGAGEWWRLVTHPFVHATWYHLLLDGTAFLALHASLAEARAGRRLAYVLASGAGSLGAAWIVRGGSMAGGLCGLSGIAHGLMAVSALEAIVLARAAGGAQRSAMLRAGWTSLALVVAKAGYEAVAGRMLFTWLHFGLMGEPVAVSHAGGVAGGLGLALAFRMWEAWRGPGPGAPAPGRVAEATRGLACRPAVSTGWPASSPTR